MRYRQGRTLARPRNAAGWHATRAMGMLAFAAAIVALLSAPPAAFSRSTDMDGNGVSQPPGRWRAARERPQSAPVEMTDEQKAEVERLRSIGYLGGYKPAPSLTGVRVYDTSLAYPGLNLYNSGHHPGAILMTMDGQVVHQWEYPFLKAYPDSVKAAKYDNAQCWRQVYLYPNGDLLAIYEGYGLIKIDRDSNLIWAYPGAAHHDLKVMDDGRIYVLTRKAHILTRINTATPVLEDFVTILDAGGHELKSVSLLEAFERSPFAVSLTVFCMRRIGDLFHTNSIDVLDGRLEKRIPAFKAGNVLFSSRILNFLAVVNMTTGKVEWLTAGQWWMQHDAKVLDNGDILVFDNKGHKGGVSKVLEFDPVTQEDVWHYWGTDDEPFYTQLCGANHRLPNGNTLIVESDNGRAFEVTRDGRTVWEFVNPERAGADGRLIATLFDVHRIDPKTLGDWVNAN